MNEKRCKISYYCCYFTKTLYKYLNQGDLKCVLSYLSYYLKRKLNVKFTFLLSYLYHYYFSAQF